MHRGNTNPGASERGFGGQDSVDACFERRQVGVRVCNLYWCSGVCGGGGGGAADVMCFH